MPRRCSATSASLSTRRATTGCWARRRELPHTQLEKFIHVGEGDSSRVIATMPIDGSETVVGEIRYAFHPETASLEFGISVGDGWQGQGIGAALLSNLACRAAAFGADRLFGDTLRSNGAMLGLARKMGFDFHRRRATGNRSGWKSRSATRRRKFPAPAGGSPRIRDGAARCGVA